MDYGYTEPCRYEVRIADNNKQLLGSGVLFVPRKDKFAYVFTVAHLFWYTEEGTLYTPSKIELFLTYARNREQVSNIKAHIKRMSDVAEHEEKNVIFLHRNYNPEKKNSSWDAAVLRIDRESWMESDMKVFRFPSAYKDTALIGWGFPQTISEMENLESGKVDSFRELLPLEGEAMMYDDNFLEIKFKHFLNRSAHDLDGYSGTGLYAGPDLFFGVFSRDVGPDESGSYAWVTAWKVFLEILDAYGDIEYIQYIVSIEYEHINLNQQAWWLPESTVFYESGLMEDRYSINLQSLLLGMTDPFTVILASVWKSGIGRSLENQIGRYISEHARNYCKRFKQQWFECDEYFTENKMNLVAEDGVVVNLHASNENIYELRQRVSKVLYQREEEAKECKLIINIWSHDPAIAFNSLQGVWEEKISESNIDFLSTVSYSMLIGKWKEVPRQKVCQMEERLWRMEPSEIEKELIMCKDMETAVWWELLKNMVKSENQEEVLLSYQAAKSYHPAMQQWIEGLGVRWCEEWRKHPEQLVNRLSGKDVDLLCWELYLYQKRCQKDKSVRWGNLLNELKKYGSGSIEKLIDMLLSQDGLINLENTTLQPEDVARWARTAGKEEFHKSLPLLKQSKPCYWSAIVNNIYGLEYVLKEVLEKRENTYTEKILNQKVSGNRDIYQEEDAEYTRSLIRRGNN